MIFQAHGFHIFCPTTVLARYDMFCSATRSHRQLPANVDRADVNARSLSEKLVFKRNLSSDLLRQQKKGGDCVDNAREYDAVVLSVAAEYEDV